jgi:hypothetical protein
MKSPSDSSSSGVVGWPAVAAVRLSQPGRGSPSMSLPLEATAGSASTRSTTSPIASEAMIRSAPLSRMMYSVSPGLRCVLIAT